MPLTQADLWPGAQQAVWAQNADAVRAFLAATTQWRSIALADGRIRTIGLDYSGVRSALEMGGIEMTPHLWRDVQRIENGAISALNED